MITHQPLVQHAALPRRRGVAPRYFELLETIAAMTGDLGRGPMQKELAAVYNVCKQRMHQRCQLLVRSGMVECIRPNVVLSHNAKLLLETGLDAQLKD